MQCEQAIAPVFSLIEKVPSTSEIYSTKTLLIITYAFSGKHFEEVVDFKNILKFVRMEKRV